MGHMDTTHSNNQQYEQLFITGSGVEYGASYSDDVAERQLIHPS